MNSIAWQEFWRAHLEAWHRSDLTQREYCANQGLGEKAILSLAAQGEESGCIGNVIPHLPAYLVTADRCKLNLEETLDMPVDLIVRQPDENSPIAVIAKTEGVAL